MVVAAAAAAAARQQQAVSAMDAVTDTGLVYPGDRARRGGGEEPEIERPAPEAVTTSRARSEGPESGSSGER